jgi:phospholipase C
MPQQKIKHVVVLMLENRSFDHLFGFRPGVNGLKGDEFNLLDPDAPQSPSNPRFAVGPGAPYAVVLGKGPPHSVAQTHFQLFGSGDARAAVANSGYVAAYSAELLADGLQASQADLSVVMQSFSPAQLPVINALADEFAICDAWHAEVPGPTHPNRLYLHAATSEGHAMRAWERTFDLKTIYQQVAEAGLSWSAYTEDCNELRQFTPLMSGKPPFKRMSQFRNDCVAGHLANYVFLCPRMLADRDGAMVESQQAPHDMRWGEHLIADVYEALRGNEAIWRYTLLVVIYDEPGGFYDHVVPPPASNPDGKNSPTVGDPDEAPAFAFDRLGHRVGAVAVSPWIPAGLVCSRKLQHTSVMKTARELFGIEENLTRRDAEASSFADLLSLEKPRMDTPAKLRRPALPETPHPADPQHPANQPLDPLQQEIVLGLHMRTQADHPDPVVLPKTQGEASAFIRSRSGA